MVGYIIFLTIQEGRLMPTGFISYQTKNGIRYARYCIARYKDGKKFNEETSLGRVIDEQKGIFKNREHGLFTFSVKEGYGPAPDTVADDAKCQGSGKCKTLLDFGDSFFLYSFLRSTPYWGVIEQVTPEKDHDTFLSLLGYYILSGGARCHAKTWWEGNYASVLFPNARLEGPRISEFLRDLGEEQTQRRFFKQYIQTVLSGPGIHGILIDSEGLPNSIDMEVTQLSNHGGDINVETRLIYICERNTGLPLYFRYISGNIVDFSTLATTIEELERAGLCTDFAILDAGYYSDGNINVLYEKNIAFVTRLKQNRVLYKELVAKHLACLQSSQNLVAFNKRFLFIKKAPCKLQGQDAFAYICKDPVMGMRETRNKVPAALADGVPQQEVFDNILKAGVFVIISSEDMSPDEILPLYYTRQQIEQVFDISKNYADILPLRVHSEETFRGHLFISFVAAIACHLLQKLFKGKGINQIEALRELRNQKCKLYEHVVIPMEPRKKMNDVYKISKIQCPVRIAIPQ